MRLAAERTAQEEAFLVRTISPQKEGGGALTPLDLSEDDWMLLRGMLIAGDMKVFLHEDGSHYIQPQATLTELITMGYLEDG